MLQNQKPDYQIPPLKLCPEGNNENLSRIKLKEKDLKKENDIQCEMSSSTEHPQEESIALPVLGQEGLVGFRRL